MSASSFTAYLRRNHGYSQVNLCNFCVAPAVSFAYVCAMDGCISTDWAPDMDKRVCCGRGVGWQGYVEKPPHAKLVHFMTSTMYGSQTSMPGLARD